jgi:iron complex outermembrane recepter protein
VRQSHNSQSFGEEESGVLVGGASSVNNHSSANVTTWMADARYHFSKDIMGYVRVATGYAPGGPNSPVPGLAIPPTVGSENLTNYELGLKTELLDHRLKVNIAGYELKWTDIQLPAETSGISYNVNGGTATSRGFELESAFVPLAGLSIGFNAAYTTAYLNSLSSAVSTGFPFLLDTQLALVPAWTVSGTLDYEFRPFTDWTAHAGAGIRWVDSQWGAEREAGQPSYLLPSYYAADFNASLTRGRWTGLFYIRNLTNQRAVQGVADGQNILGVSEQLDYYLLQPRTIGIGAVAKFD